MSDDPCSPATHAAGHHLHHRLAHHVGRHVRLRSIRATAHAAPAPSPEAVSCGKHFDASQPAGLARSPLGHAVTSASVPKAAVLATSLKAALASMASLGLLASLLGLTGRAGQPATSSMPDADVTAPVAAAPAGSGSPIGPALLPSLPPAPGLSAQGQGSVTGSATPTPVPEPASAVLVASAGVVAMLMRYRRRRRAT